MRWGNNDLTSWLSGGSRSRELAETRRSWNDVERAWAASPLRNFDDVGEIVHLVHDAVPADRPAPSTSIVVELALAADTLLGAEHTGEITPLWDVIEADAAAAVEFRSMLTRRRRWALDFELLWSVFRSQLVRAYGNLIEALPETCFPGAESDDAPFTVPLSSLVECPVEVIERMILSAYDDDVFRYDLFHHLRERFASNIVIASGFAPGTNPHEVQHKLVMPTRHKSANASELADLYLGGTPFEALLDLPVPFSIPMEARFEHCHIVGGTGHGKTQLLQRMIHADLLAARDDGRSVVVIDSQGDLIRKLVRLDLFDPRAPGSLADRLVLIDPADVEYPPSLNLFDAPKARLEGYGAADRERALNGLIELYETFFGDLLGAELTQKQGVIFRYLARLMLAIPGANIHTLMQLMENGRPFKPHMDALDGSARHFFATEFFHPSFAATKKQILKRLWGVLSTPAFERMFAQPSNKLDLFDATNEGKIILINTAKDLLKTEGSALFGRFFIAMLAQAALERSTLPERERTPTFVYVDEAQEYFDDSIETILAQGRKYKISFAAAHQAIDQLSPRLRSVFLANTSLKCAGGVSSKDAHGLASELHCEPEFIEGMKRRRGHTEFALWLKHRTSAAIRLDVPLGFLERQRTLTEEQYDELIDQNRARYCGTLGDVLEFESPALSAEEPIEEVPIRPRREASVASSLPPRLRPRPEPAIEMGKGGPRHRYLQSLVAELAQQQGFRATIEAPLEGGGQADVLLEREGVRVAVEVSVSTPVEQERQNVRKCLDAGFSHIALVLAKSKATQGRYAVSVLEDLSEKERTRLSILAPEEIPDYIGALAPPPAPTESTVRGWRVRVSRTPVSPEEVKERRDQLAKLVARSLSRKVEDEA